MSYDRATEALADVAATRAPGARCVDTAAAHARVATELLDALGPFPLGHGDDLSEVETIEWAASLQLAAAHAAAGALWADLERLDRDDERARPCGDAL